MLLAFNVINGPSADAKVPLLRHEACEFVRQHLCDHSDVGLQPRVRSEAGDVVEVARDVHNRAFLEHHKHASAIASFLVERFGLQSPSYVRPFRVVVFSRFDGASINSIDEGIDIIFPGGEGLPPQELILYCNSSASTIGLHYDPMVLRPSGRASKRQGRGKMQAQTKEPLSSGGARKRRKQQVHDEVDPHDEVPTFMRVVSNRRGVEAAVESGDVPLNDNNADADNMFYEVSAMDEWDTPDVLRKKCRRHWITYRFSFAIIPRCLVILRIQRKNFLCLLRITQLCYCLVSIVPLKVVLGLEEMPRLKWIISCKCMKKKIYAKR